MNHFIMYFQYFDVSLFEAVSSYVAFKTPREMLNLHENGIYLETKAKRRTDIETP